MAEENLDLNNDGENNPNPDPSKVKEDLKNPEAEIEKQVDELLKDGTPSDKEITVSKKAYDERNEKAKVYDTFAPVLDKIKDKPELIDELLDTKKKGDLETRIARMEEAEKEKKRNEMRSALTEALSKWPNFGNDWREISEDVERLMKKGHSARDAMSRSYIALHPEEAQAEAVRMARENASMLGKQNISSSYSPKIKVQPENEVQLTPGERQVAKSLGKSEAEYSALLKKHESHMRARGFYKEELETQL